MEQLTDVTSSLTAKTEALAELASQVATLQRSFDEARADADAKQSTVDELEKSKSDAESELAAAKESLVKLQAENEESGSLLKAVKEEVRLHGKPSDSPADETKRLSARDCQGRASYSGGARSATASSDRETRSRGQVC